MKDVRFGLTPDDTLVSGFSGMYSPYLRTVTNRGAPRELDVSGAFSIKPTISAIVEENNTSEERACYVDITVESTASYWTPLKDSTSKAVYRCYFIQEAGSSTVSVTFDSNGGADAAPSGLIRTQTEIHIDSGIGMSNVGNFRRLPERGLYLMHGTHMHRTSRKCIICQSMKRPKQRRESRKSSPTGNSSRRKTSLRRRI